MSKLIHVETFIEMWKLQQFIKLADTMKSLILQAKVPVLPIF